MTTPVAGVPFALLESLIHARGGLSAVLNAGGIRWDSPDWDRFEKAVKKGADTGRMTIRAADQFAVEALGMHPSSVWGDVWWDAADAHLEQSATGVASWPAAS